MDRYVNNELFLAISCHQYDNTCHLTSITAVFQLLIFEFSVNKDRRKTTIIL